MSNPLDSTTSTFKKDAVAFMNIILVAADGTEYRLPKGIALRDVEGTPLERAILKQWKDDPSTEFKVKADIKSAVKSTDIADITF